MSRCSRTFGFLGGCFRAGCAARRHAACWPGAAGVHSRVPAKLSPGAGPAHDTAWDGPATSAAARASRAAARAPRVPRRGARTAHGLNARIGRYTRRCRLNALHLPLTGSSPGCRTGEASAGPAQWQCVSPVTAISSLRGCGSSRPPLITHSPPNTPFYYLINAHCQRARAECSCKP